MPSTPLRGWQVWLLLTLANLFWAGNWIAGRALREFYTPLALNLWRWALAALILAPFAWPVLRGQGALLRRHLPLLLALAASGAAMFQAMVYFGVQRTSGVNAVLIGSAAPLFVMALAWGLQQEKARPAQWAGVVVSLAGIALILGEGDPRRLLALRVHEGDLWILFALPVWGLYSVLLRRLPRALQGSASLFAMAALAVPMMWVAAAAHEPAALQVPLPSHPAALLGLGYVALFPSVLAFSCWNRAIAEVGPNAAALSLPLMPLFGTVLAVALLGEPLHGFHLLGMAGILVGIAIASRTPLATPRPARVTRH